jgi:hypothetical protein
MIMCCAGDKWCLCAARWKEALAAGCAPPLYLKSTHIKVMRLPCAAVLCVECVTRVAICIPPVGTCTYVWDDGTALMYRMA